MKYKFIILYFIILFLNSIIYSQTTIQFAEYESLSNGILDRNPHNSNNTECTYQFKIWIIQLSGGNFPMTVQITSVGGLNGNVFPVYSNSTHFLYRITSYSDTTIIGDAITIKATRNSFENEISYSIACNEFNINNISIDMGYKIYFDWFLGHVVYFKTSGVPSYVGIEAVTGNLNYQVRVIEQDHYILLVNYGNLYDQSLSGSLEIDFYFSGQFITKSIPGYYNSMFNDPNIKIDYYPSNFFDQPIQLTGKSLYPLMTIEIATQAQPIEPYFAFVSTYGGYIGLFAPIYESNGKTTYIVTPYIVNLFQPQVSFYTQNKTTAYQIFNNIFNIQDVQTSTYILPDFEISVNVAQSIPMLNLLNSDTTYDYKLNPFRITISSISIDIGAPYGFLGPSNIEYQYQVSIPLCMYNPTVSVGIGGYGDYVNIPGNTNVQDSNGPRLVTYSFQYIRNYIYIFHAEIQDDGCGAGFISFDGGITRKRLSQYIVDGDYLLGVYEIPIDFNLDSFFASVTLGDLCGYTYTYKNNEIPFVGFNPFVAPFLSNTYALQSKISNITFLYNFLDVRNYSVPNIIYFNCDGAETTTPFSFRLPVLDQYETIGYFTHEYFGSWNSSINKFQIEFIVPKNSRLGQFEYSIGNGLLNFVSSEYLPSDSQLIISKSNFDGIGPVFSKVESIPFSNGKFGWSLTISDPINGFDNGTITVMGSQDNSIYKFDLFPSNATSGNSTEGVYEIIIDLGSNYCITQDYIITFVKLWDTGAKYTVFEYQKPLQNHIPNQLINPFYLFLGISTINKYSVSECTASNLDDTPPSLISFDLSNSIIDVGSYDSSITFNIQVDDPESGINTKAQGPIVYINSLNFDTVQCISTFISSTTSTNALYKCTTQLPVGFSSSQPMVYVSIYGIINNHGLYSGYSSQTLSDMALSSYQFAIEYSESYPLLLESGIASSKGGEYFIYGRSLAQVETLTIINAQSGETIGVYYDFNIIANSVILKPNLEPIKSDFYVLVTTASGITSNKLLVSPLIFNDYTPSEDSSSSGSSSSSDNSTPLPTNAPQQCLGNPICGGPTHGTCNSLTGCICIYPWKGKSCQDKVIEPVKPDPNPNEPSTGIDIPDDNDDSSSSNPANNIKYKSLISLYSLREVDINGNTVKNHKFNNMWTFNQLSDLISTYHINVTTGENGFNTTVSATLEWFNQSRTITFAGQDLEMNANSIKYSIDISSYPFSNTLNHLQLVMSATLTSTSSDSCSSKDFGDTTSGDNSNYINIQIDNKSLYGRFIKRGIIDNNRTVSLSNELLDSKLNAISTPSTSQSYIGITIPQFKERATIDPDFSVLLNSNSASSKSNSVCKSKGLSGAKIAGIVIGSVAFAAIIIISITYHFKKKRDDKRFKSNIQNKLKQMDG